MKRTTSTILLIVLCVCMRLLYNYIKYIFVLDTQIIQHNIIQQQQSSSSSLSLIPTTTRLPQEENYVTTTGRNNVEQKYLNDDDYPSVRSFPRWDDQYGISIQSIIDFIPYSIHSINTNSPFTITVTDSPANYNDDNATTISKADHFHEILYVIERKQLYTNFHGLHFKNKTTNHTEGRNDIQYMNYRLRPIRYILQLMLRIIKFIHYSTDTTNLYTNRWKRLHTILFINNSSIPFFLYGSDYTGCGYHNWKRRSIDNNDNNSYNNSVYSLSSIPIMTFPTDIDCNYSFPLPTYKTIIDCKKNSTQWIEQIKNWSIVYPIYEKKIQQIVWRGSLTGPLDENYSNIRWRLPYYIYNNISNDTIRQMLNIGIHKIPKRHDNNIYLNISQIGDIKDGIYPSSNLQNYMGILDMDGNSWSSRFGSLLCYNSIILKIQPQYIDYFYYPMNSSESLKPYIHYIPIYNNLSNFIEQILYVLDINNYDIIKHIVYNANQWCINNMIETKIAKDYLDIFEQYIHYLDMNNTNWNIIWNQYRNHNISSLLYPL